MGRLLQGSIQIGPRRQPKLRAAALKLHWIISECGIRLARLDRKEQDYLTYVKYNGRHPLFPR